MALHITETEMACTTIPAYAVLTEHRKWALHLLPNELAALHMRCFNRNAAITALTLAEVLALNPAPDSPLRHAIANWRAELNLPPERN